MSENKNRMFSTNPPREEPGLTIVGGRPPGEGNAPSQIPRGIEVLIKKAAVDPEFRALLIAKRDEAAKEIGLELTSIEKSIIRSAPESQLISIINSVKISPNLKPILLGKVAGVMLAALSVAALSSCFTNDSGSSFQRSAGSSPPDPEIISPTATTDAGVTNITRTSVTLNAIVDPNGTPTTVYFEYGITTTYGTVTPTKDIGSSIDPVNVSEDITGLLPNTTYNFRIVAIKYNYYTVYGENKTFTTSN